MFEMLFWTRRSLSSTEEELVSLLLAGEDPVLQRLLEQMKPEHRERANRFRLHGTTLARGPDLGIYLGVVRQRARSLSVAKLAPGLRVIADLIVRSGNCQYLAALSIDGGYIGGLVLRKHVASVPNVIRRIDDYGYKRCGHWDDPDCGDFPRLGDHERQRLDISRRYPPRPSGAGNVPQWLAPLADDIEPATPASAADIAACAATLGVELPKDLVEMLRWSNGLDVGTDTIFGTSELYLLDKDTTHRPMLVVHQDASGDMTALSLDEPSKDSAVVYALTHDPSESQRIAGSYRDWVKRLVRDELGSD